MASPSCSFERIVYILVWSAVVLGVTALPRRGGGTSSRGSSSSGGYSNQAYPSYSQQDRKPNQPNRPEYIYAVCHFDKCTENGCIIGTVDFRQLITGGLTDVRMNVTGLNVTEELSLHGLTINVDADISDDCKNTGSHFNPLHVSHGGRLQSPFQRHVGDLGNVKEDMFGDIVSQFRDYLIQLQGQFSIIGKPLVLYSRSDDLGTGGTSESTTTGDSGEPLACCVIGSSSGHRWITVYGEEDEEKK